VVEIGKKYFPISCRS